MKNVRSGKHNLLGVMAVVFAVGLMVVGAAGQVPDVEAQVKTVPKVAYPAEAKATGLEGVVTAFVDVDEAGKVTQVEKVTGPDWVCPAVTRADVAARSEERRGGEE